MTGFERQPTLWGHYQRSRCLSCKGVSSEVPRNPAGDAALDRWEPKHAQLHAREDDAA